MDFKRRSFLFYSSSIAVGLVAQSARAQSIDFSQADVAATRELQGLLDKAREQNLIGAEVASAGSRSILDLAEVIAKALKKGSGDESSFNVAVRAGLLLSEVARNDRDGLDHIPSDAEPASAKHKYNDIFKHEYAELFKSATISPAHVPELTRAAKFILSPFARQRYEEVQNTTRVPWYVIGAIHYREANLNFMGHLHNGDPLLLLTIHVPINKPKARPWPPNGPRNPRELWRRSAVDALERIRKLTPSWTLQRTCFSLEAYNGFGCRNFGIHTPYLWNYTNHYSGGGFPRDHHFDPAYRSKQAGLVAILVRLRELAGDEIRFDIEA
jgi:lysozyme family protein